MPLDLWDFHANYGANVLFARQKSSKGEFLGFREAIVQELDCLAVFL